MPNKTALTIIVSVILTIILVSLINVGTSIILKEPKYEDYCSIDFYRYESINMTKEEIAQANQGSERCSKKYDEEMKEYNQYKYYIFASIGFILLLVGLFSKEMMIQLVGLGAGGILMVEGIVINLENKIIVFFSLLAILIIFGIVAWKVINKTK